MEAAAENNIKLIVFDRPNPNGHYVDAPNPSSTVKAFEGTASVSEAAAIKVSNGKLIVEKQKFPPNLTIAIARKVE